MYQLIDTIDKSLDFIKNTELLICGAFDGDGRIDEIELRQWQDELQSNKILVQHLIEEVKNTAKFI